MPTTGGSCRAHRGREPAGASTSSLPHTVPSGRRRPPHRDIPDGLTAEAAGAVWVAIFDGAAVHRYSTDGELDRVIALPAASDHRLHFRGRGAHRPLHKHRAAACPVRASRHRRSNARITPTLPVGQDAVPASASRQSQATIRSDALHSADPFTPWHPVPTSRISGRCWRHDR
ncbi:SMP-30/gluconolactonase/LRE family protein [Nocardia sp. NPDC050697]|uniref:SMP-30/gluconolactonase/LRE family protein n=1 Tax=Nocardia sp. NPDC050697 TaxID=3155158 RepID=UPI0033FCEBDD